jgi:hypothetical protein
MHGRDEKCVQNFGRKTCREEPLERPRHRYEDNIRIDLRRNRVERLWARRSGFNGSIPGECWEFFSSPPCPDRLWSPPSLLCNGYQGLFPWGVKLTTHLRLMPRLKSQWSCISTPPIRLHDMVLSFKKSTGTSLPLILPLPWCGLDAGGSG